ncbi:MAG TPA: dTDP-glucose 4,6-dehydratase [Chloroflexi bacterium]|nr:dTDP-glucose 4,6-dehydratase [Chloroflexota bacterium]
MRRLLVTGGAGFIGANFVHLHLREYPDDRVVVLDALTYAGNRANLAGLEGHPGFRFVHGDIREQERVEALLREERIDTVVHFAAESHVDRSIVGPDAFIETNVGGTHSLLKAARAVWLESDDAPADPLFHHVSTDEVYGSLEAGEAPFTEAHPYAPNSPYSASKAASDHLVRAYHHTYGLPVTTSNCSNNYGPYQFPEKLIPLMLINLLEGRSLPIYGDGRNVRDWLYVEDHNRAIERIIESGRRGEVYNIGGNCERTNLEIVERLCDLVEEAFGEDESLAARFPACPVVKGGHGRDLITYVKDRPGHDRRYAIDASRLRDELGFGPRESFDSGFRKTLRWYLENEAWWRAVMDGSYREWTRVQYGDC